MTWNHRVVKKVFNKGTENEEEQYSIREVFYNSDGAIFAHTENPIDLACESLEGLKQYIEWCLNAFDKPILIDGEVEFAKDNFSEEDSLDMDKIFMEEEIEQEFKKWDEEENK